MRVANSVFLLIVLTGTSLEDNNGTTRTQQEQQTSWCPSGYRLKPSAMDECQLMSCRRFKQGLVPFNVPNDAQVIPEANGTVLVCQAPTQDFLQCSKTLLTTPGYFKTFDNDSRIFVVVQRNTFMPVIMGEYVIVSDDEAIVCADTTDDHHDEIRKIKTNVDAFSESCMPFTLPSNCCQTIDTGDVYLTKVGIYIPMGFYQIDQEDQYHLCYGTSGQFSSCPLYGGIPSAYTVVFPNMTLYTNLSIVETYPLGSYVWTKDRSYAVVCIDNSATMQPVTVTEKYVKGTAMILSCVFIVATLLVHLIFPSINYHAKPLLCHIISLFVMYVSTTVRFLHSMYNTTRLQCYAMFMLSYVSTLGAFFWLSVIAFDLWRVFTNMRPTVLPVSTAKKNRKFVLQCIYAWGIPIVLCILGLTVATNPKMQDALNLEFPLLNYCWFVSTKSILIFLYVPIITILVENVIFFLLTVINLHKASKDADILNKKVSRQLFKIFVKLFIVMGLFWFAEFISWLLNAQNQGWTYPTDLINCLEGVAIFFIYVFKKKTVRVIRDRLGCHKKRKGGSVNTTSVRGTSPGQLRQLSTEVTTARLSSNKTRQTSESVLN